MYVFRVSHLTLDKQLMCSSLRPFLSFRNSQLPVVLCVALRFPQYKLACPLLSLFGSCLGSHVGVTLSFGTNVILKQLPFQVYMEIDQYLDSSFFIVRNLKSIIVTAIHFWKYKKEIYVKNIRLRYRSVVEPYL